MLEQKKLVEIVGKDNVLDNQVTLEAYSKDISPVHQIRPQYIVKPKNGDEVQKLVICANETLTPLVPISSGQPHFRGDTVPSRGDSIIVDLSKMKNIIRIDPRNRVAMIEPGVTFGELIPRLKEEGLRLNMPLLPRSSKSVLGSALEREPVLLPIYQWDGGDPLACAEIIFGTGDKFRTGSAAGPGDLEYQWSSGAAQVSSIGPAQADFGRFIQGAQGTMGIATWITVRCERLPRQEAPFFVGSSELGSLFELVHWIIRLRSVNECFLLNNNNLAHILTKQNHKEYEAIKNALPPWVLFLCLAGYEYFPEERLSLQKETLSNLTRRLELKAIPNISHISALELLKIVQKPSEDPYWKLSSKGSCYDIFFLAVHDKLPELIGIMNDLAKQHRFPVSDIGVYIQPIVQGTSYHCEFNLFFNPNNPEEVERVRKVSITAPDILINKGAFFSRPYGPWAGTVFNKNAEIKRGLKKIKNIFDPNNIMNPGKLCFND